MTPIDEVRVEVMVYDRKMLEVIVPDLAAADRIWHTWCELRNSRNLPMGGASMHSATRRIWPIQVGDILQEEDK